MKQQIHIKHL